MLVLLSLLGAGYGTYTYYFEKDYPVLEIREGSVIVERERAIPVCREGEENLCVSIEECTLATCIEYTCESEAPEWVLDYLECE